MKNSISLACRLVLCVFAVVVTDRVASAEVHAIKLTSTDLHLDQQGVQNALEPLQKKIPGGWSVLRHSLQGGKQEGVDFIELHNGKMMIRVIPTRGMSIYDVLIPETPQGAFRLGWNSPVKEVVHPQYVNLESRGGLGWLEGFNEMMVRCGLEFAGHPGKDVFITNTGDKGEMDLTVHGKIGNIPASEVELLIDDEQNTLTLRGVVHERLFFGPKLELVTELTTTIGSSSFTIRDRVTNRGSGPQEMQLIYHCNFGQPLLEAGAKVHVAHERIAPMNLLAAKDIGTFSDYLGPTPGYIEQVYLFHPLFDKQGVSHVLLHNAAGDRGCSLSWNKSELPYLTLWKNTTAVEDGYVTGLEPATGFPYNRRVEREFGRVPKLAAGETREFNVMFNLHIDKASVDTMRKTIGEIQGSMQPVVETKPPYVAE